MRFARVLLSCTVVMTVIVGFLVISLLVALAKREAVSLPPLSSLHSRTSAVTSRMYDGAGLEVGRFAERNRTPVSLESIPDIVVNAFLSAEDHKYWQHRGVDPGAIARALVTNFHSRGTGRRAVGASTITQQVVKNMLLGDEHSLRRKVREMLVALRMDRELGKRHVLELYLNEIYLGEGAYGVSAAAEAWFGKSLDKLGIEEAAFLAGLPKAPSAYDPVRRPDAARARRAYVLGRMREDHVLTREQEAIAAASPLPRPSGVRLGNAAVGWFPEAARREVVNLLGTSALYKGGLRVSTSMDPALQEAGELALRNGLVAFDRRHGWRGALGRITGVQSGQPSTWITSLSAWVPPPGAGAWRLAVVVGIDHNGAAVMGFADGSATVLSLEGVRWTRAGLRKPADIVSVGDVVLVSLEGTHLELRQVPRVQGSLVAMEVDTGRVLAIVGGQDAAVDKFNRATQGLRQPGSTFKTLVYLAAFEAGFDPTSPLLDVPIALESSPGKLWRPDGGNSMGLITLRKALELSRNLATVRLSNELGLDVVSAIAVRLGVYDSPLAAGSMGLGAAAALGAVETTNLRLTTAYAVMANGGKAIHAGLLDTVRDDTGRVLWSRPAPGPQVVNPVAAAQVVSVLEGVVRVGTAAPALSKMGMTMAGKTGTTNANMDAWFVGMVPGMAVGVHIGFDHPEDMGVLETGGMATAPVFGEFVKAAASIHPVSGTAPVFRVPPEAQVLRVDPVTGQESSKGVIEIMRR